MLPAINHRAGLVGTGYISEYHVAALRRLGNVEIVGVVDLDAERAARLAARLGLTVYPSLAALRAAGAEVIHVLTPPDTHAAVTLEALDLGCHVLVEKPLATDVGDCELIQQRAASRGLAVCVNHSLLFDPQVRRARDIVRNGRLGTVVSVDILRSSVYPPFPGGSFPPQYRSAGYPFRDLGVHALYLMEAFLGPIERVDADYRSLGGDPNLAYDEWRAMVRCRDGLGQIQLSWNVKPIQSQIIVQGTRGVLRTDLFLMFNALRASTPLPKAAERLINAATDLARPQLDVIGGVWGFLRKRIRPYQGLQDLVAAFYRSLATRSPVPVSVADATRVVAWTEQVARAADQRHQLRVAELRVAETVPYLVTGASGGLGREVVNRLRTQGHRVRIMVRRIPDCIPEGVEVALGDLGDSAAVDRAVRGAQIVIHVGAAMHGGQLDHQRATVAGTRHVLEACLRHHVRQLVHISSLSVIDWAGSPEDAPVTESTSYEPRPAERGHYTQAKLQAEQLVTECTREHHLPTVILRPGQIFGGRIPLMTGAIARRLGKRWLVLGNGKLRLPLIYIDDVVDAIIAAADSGLHNGEIVQLVDPDPLTQNQVIQLVLGRGTSVLRMPRWFVFALGAGSDLALRLVKRRSPIAPYRLRSALASRTFVSENAHLLPSWKVAVGIREGIRRLADTPARQPVSTGCVTLSAGAVLALKGPKDPAQGWAKPYPG